MTNREFVLAALRKVAEKPSGFKRVFTGRSLRNSMINEEKIEVPLIMRELRMMKKEGLIDFIYHDTSKSKFWLYEINTEDFKWKGY